jgi:hypothetical protein
MNVLLLFLIVNTVVACGENAELTTATCQTLGSDAPDSHLPPTCITTTSNTTTVAVVVLMDSTMSRLEFHETLTGMAKQLFISHTEGTLDVLIVGVGPTVPIPMLSTILSPSHVIHTLLGTAVPVMGVLAVGREAAERATAASLYGLICDRARHVDQEASVECAKLLRPIVYSNTNAVESLKTWVLPVQVSSHWTAKEKWDPTVMVVASSGCKEITELPRMESKVPQNVTITGVLIIPGDCPPVEMGHNDVQPYTQVLNLLKAFSTKFVDSAVTTSTATAANWLACTKDAPETLLRIIHPSVIDETPPSLPPPPEQKSPPSNDQKVPSDKGSAWRAFANGLLNVAESVRRIMWAFVSNVGRCVLWIAIKISLRDVIIVAVTVLVGYAIIQWNKQIIKPDQPAPYQTTPGYVPHYYIPSGSF